MRTRHAKEEVSDWNEEEIDRQRTLRLLSYMSRNDRESRDREEGKDELVVGESDEGREKSNEGEDGRSVDGEASAGVERRPHHVGGEPDLQGRRRKA